jgi:hypothetical protein
MAMTIVCVAAYLFLTSFTTTAGAASAQPAQATAGDTQTLAEFQKRIATYLALHKKVVAGHPGLPTRATPEQIDAALQDLSRGIAAARAGAKVGDVFVPAMQVYLRRVLQRAFSGDDGKLLRASILDENPIGVSISVNGQYPDTIPLSTMPPKVLEALPRLPAELQFRFVGDRLILFDHHAHLIVDYVDRALPQV